VLEPLESIVNLLQAASRPQSGRVNSKPRLHNRFPRGRLLYGTGFHVNMRECANRGLSGQDSLLGTIQVSCLPTSGLHYGLPIDTRISDRFISESCQPFSGHSWPLQTLFARHASDAYIVICSTYLGSFLAMACPGQVSYAVQP
jgi:hypothetical protein